MQFPPTIQDADLLERMAKRLKHAGRAAALAKLGQEAKETIKKRSAQERKARQRLECTLARLRSPFPPAVARGPSDNH